MSAIEEAKPEVGVRKAPEAQVTAGVTRVLNFLSSVRFGVVLLVLLVLACMVGMLIMQQNVDGFDKYYAELTPAQKWLYGKLGVFDIYHVWYFNVLLLVLSLNIVLASIDRFPTAWTYIKRKKLDAKPHWLRGQEQSAELRLAEGDPVTAVSRVETALRDVRYKTTVTEKGGKWFVFAERGAWNRLGAYAVHVALLTIFFGGFLTAQFGRVGNMPLEPGRSSNEMTEQVVERDQFTIVPHKIEEFTVECTDIQQKLIRKDGPITADNTLDWLTRIKIRDNERGTVTEAVVHMNKPFDYRGYRFFQASFIADGKARQATVRVTPVAGGQGWDVTIPRDGVAELPDGTRIEMRDFSANFRLGNQQMTEEQSVYQNPAATLAVTRPGGAPARAIAFTPEMAERAPIARQPVEGYTFRLVDYEKVPRAHILSVQRDPGATVVYVGFGLLALTLSAVFFFSHERVWAVVEGSEGGGFNVTFGGNTNRNKLAFGDRFRRVVEGLGGEVSEVKKS